MTDTEHDLFERMAREIYREFENRPKYAQAQMNGVIAEECAAAALAVAKPMIERELLRALQNVAAGMPPEMQAGVHDAVDIVSEARGIDLKDETNGR